VAVIHCTIKQIFHIKFAEEREELLSQHKSITKACESFSNLRGVDYRRCTVEECNMRLLGWFTVSPLHECSDLEQPEDVCWSVHGNAIFQHIKHLTIAKKG
jgi:hypothetical protein